MFFSICEANTGVTQSESARQKILVTALEQFVALAWATLASVARTKEESRSMQSLSRIRCQRRR